MSANTYIQWCDDTFNPWIGCTKVSPGCANCYAEGNAASKFLGVKWGKGQERHRTSETTWNGVRGWNRSAGRGYARPTGQRRRVFCASLADWLDDEVPIEWLADLLTLIHDTPNLDWLLLTKRPENWETRVHQARDKCFYGARPVVAAWLDGEPMENVWFGVSVENQKRADERIPELLKIPARVRFLSIEPLLGSIDFADLPGPAGREGLFRGHALTGDGFDGNGVDWVIVGGESGPRARPCDLNWVWDIVIQCKAAGVACFVKQLGSRLIGDESEFPKDITKFYTGGVTQSFPSFALNHPKGGDMSEWPEDLRVREFPGAAREYARPTARGLGL